MAELIVDMLVSVDGSARGTRSPGHFGLCGPDRERWIAEEDEVRLLVFPLVLGASGAEPLFRDIGDLALELADQRVLGAGTLFLDYRPAGDPPYADEPIG